MGLFQQFIKQSKQRVWAFGLEPDLPVPSRDGAMMADEAGPQADQHRARLSKRIVNRTSDLSSVRDGDSKPVLDLGQENDSNEGMSNDYVGNSSVSSVSTALRDSVTLDPGNSPGDPLRTRSLERDGFAVKTGIHISDSQSCKAQKTESENKRVELDAGEETGLPKGNRTGPVADILLPDNQAKTSESQTKSLAPNPDGTPDMDVDGMLFNTVATTQKQTLNAHAPRTGDGSAVAVETALDHPGIPPGVHRALEAVQADFARQPGNGADRQTKPLDKHSDKVSIGRVSVRVTLPEDQVPAPQPAPVFCAEKLASRYFMGEASWH